MNGIDSQPPLASGLTEVAEARRWETAWANASDADVRRALREPDDLLPGAQEYVLREAARRGISTDYSNPGFKTPALWMRLPRAVLVHLTSWGRRHFIFCCAGAGYLEWIILWKLSAIIDPYPALLVGIVMLSAMIGICTWPSRSYRAIGKGCVAAVITAGITAEVLMYVHSLDFSLSRSFQNQIFAVVFLGLPSFLAAATLLWCRNMWYPAYPPGCCSHCGYDLRGSTPGICPECGKAGIEATIAQ